MSYPSDRTVHATCGTESLVRYDRAGKWYVEFDATERVQRRKVTLAQAVTIAANWSRRTSGEVHLGRLGGARFDAAFRRAVSE